MTDTTLTTNGLFAATDYTKATIAGTIDVVPVQQITLARNPRKHINEDGIHRLAQMIMRSGQLVPAIGRRVSDDDVLLYAGQRRLLAVTASAQLAGTDGYEDLAPVSSLVVLCLDYEPTDADIRRIQAQENAREDLSMQDQQDQFRDCWEDRIGMAEKDRIAAVCDDLGIAPKKAWSLMRQLTLPEQLRARVCARPAGNKISVTMANKLADMTEVAPDLAIKVAERITSADLHDQALRDLGAFVHKTVVENDTVYAVRIDLGALLDAGEQITRAHGELTAEQLDRLRSLFAEEDSDEVIDAEKLDKELELLATRASRGAVKVRVDEHLRDRALNGRFAYVHRRGEDYADSIWVIDPAFMIDVCKAAVEAADEQPADEEQFFGGARLEDDDMKEAAEEARKRKEAERQEALAAASRNIGLGQDIAAGLMEPTGDQLSALRDLVCHLLCQQHPDLVAFGAGWTNRDRQQPVGDTGRYEPREAQAIVAAELTRALQDTDPLRGIAHLLSRFGAAFVLDAHGVTKTKALGSDRMARKLREALPGGENPIRTALWQFMRPMLSPALVEMHRDAFVFDEEVHTTVDLEALGEDRPLDSLDLGEELTDLASGA